MKFEDVYVIYDNVEHKAKFDMFFTDLSACTAALQILNHNFRSENGWFNPKSDPFEAITLSEYLKRYGENQFNKGTKEFMS